ncbi:hypothetical protein [Amnibacterium setariae]|uniref:DUF3558 domain-containing protein n=1 Tax=Amnibacterium setariae TaxID=2306585 RepID=A0A3A1TVZ9_9MICO|nr:hypothetical protein [Amnibacterium setariae]RIX28433.1 hypothetical protein D1781_13450 [Amnibacterium setariae]
MIRSSLRPRRASGLVGVLAIPLLALVALSACATSSTAVPADAPRDADGRPIDPGPASPSTCVTRAYGGPQSSCVPVHDPPSRVYVEQSIDALLRTRAYSGVEHPRCTERLPGTPSDSDPAGLDAFSHWTCVGEEIRGRYLHMDVIWSPAVGYLGLNAVTRDLSPDFTVPKPNDPGLPNPYLPDASATPSPSRSLSQHELAAR